MAKKTMQPITKENSYGRRMVPEYLIDKLEKAPAKLVASGSIKDLTTDEINNLQAGDIVVKTTGDQKHTYIVTYKEEGQGICMTYVDASVVETVSYDYTDGQWVYNSTDVTPIANPLMKTIKDDSGNLRFVEGDVSIYDSLTGITKTYGRWSLSGSHLMIVLGLTIANGTSLTSPTAIGYALLPEWIMNKIAILWGADSVSLESFTFIQSTIDTQDVLMSISKGTGILVIYNRSNITFTSEKNGRIQFDLLIDN